jgi:hypothetical protein
MHYRLTDDAAVVLVKTQDGELRYHSQGGPTIEWMSAEQAEHYESLGLVERDGND